MVANSGRVVEPFKANHLPADVDHEVARRIIVIAGCEFQAPQKGLRLINVNAINFMPCNCSTHPHLATALI
jgi:hypothetical protein